MAAKVFPLAPLPPAPIAALQHLAELVASLWPMQACCPRLMRSGAHASPPMGRAARCAPAVPGARELPKLCAYLVLLAGLVNSPRDARKQWHELQLFGIF